VKGRLLLVILAVGIILYLLTILEHPSGVVVGDLAPSFTLPSLSGEKSLKEFQGRVVLINFWATWCPPCLEEMPTLEYLSKSYGGDGLVVLGVSLDEGWEPVKAFLKKHPLSFEILLDQNGEVASLYGTYRLPESYLIDSQGIVRRKYVGPRDWSDEALINDIQAALRPGENGDF
jgi:peroxiredoxin